eukprot:Hpha_TRINITY_DN3134_c0_g1::TRINITY_DN3134_c0_g1_i1::g.96761::m.96761
MTEKRTKSGPPRGAQEFRAWEQRQQHERHRDRVRTAVHTIDDRPPRSVAVDLGEHRREVRRREQEQWRQHVSRLNTRLGDARHPCLPQGRSRSPALHPRVPQPPDMTARSADTSVGVSHIPLSSRSHVSHFSNPSEAYELLREGASAREAALSNVADAWAQQYSDSPKNRLTTRARTAAESRTIAAGVTGAVLVIVAHAVGSSELQAQWRRSLLVALCVQQVACQRLTERLKGSVKKVKSAEGLERQLMGAEDRLDKMRAELADAHTRERRSETRAAALIDDLRTVLRQRGGGGGGGGDRHAGGQTTTAVVLSGSPDGSADGTYLAAPGSSAWEGPRGWRLVWERSGKRMWADAEGRWCVGDLSNLRPTAVALDPSTEPVADEYAQEAGRRWAGMREGVSTLVMGSLSQGVPGLNGEIGCSVDFADANSVDFRLSWGLFDTSGARIDSEGLPSRLGAVTLALDDLPAEAQHVVLVANLGEKETDIATLITAVLVIAVRSVVLDGPLYPLERDVTDRFKWGLPATWMARLAAVAAGSAIVTATEVETTQQFGYFISNGDMLPIYAESGGDRLLFAPGPGMSGPVEFSTVCLDVEGGVRDTVSMEKREWIKADEWSAELDLAGVPKEIASLQMCVRRDRAVKDGHPTVRITGPGVHFGTYEEYPSVDVGVPEVAEYTSVIAVELQRVGASKRCWIMRTPEARGAPSNGDKRMLHLRIAGAGGDYVARGMHAGSRRVAVAVLTRVAGVNKEGQEPGPERGWVLQSCAVPLPRVGLPAEHMSAVLPEIPRIPDDAKDASQIAHVWSSITPLQAVERGRSLDTGVRGGAGGRVFVDSAGHETEFEATEEKMTLPGGSKLDSTLVWRPREVGQSGRWVLLPPGGKRASSGGAIEASKEQQLHKAPGPHCAEWGSSISVQASTVPRVAVGLRLGEATSGAGASTGEEEAEVAWAYCSRLTARLGDAERKLARCAVSASPLLYASTSSPQETTAGPEALVDSALQEAPSGSWSEEIWQAHSQPAPLDYSRIGAAARRIQKLCTESDGDLLDELVLGLRVPPERDSVETFALVLLSARGLAARVGPLGQVPGGPLSMLLLRLISSSSTDTDRLLLWAGVPPPGDAVQESLYRERLVHQDDRRNVALTHAVSVEGDRTDMEHQWARTTALLWALAEGGGNCGELKRNKGDAFRVLVPGKQGGGSLRKLAEDFKLLSGLPMGERRVIGFSAPLVVGMSERIARRRLQSTGPSAIILIFKGLVRGLPLRPFSPCPRENTVLVPPFTLFNVGNVSGGDGLTPLEVVLTYRESLADLPENSAFVAAQEAIALRASDRLVAVTRGLILGKGDTAIVPLLLAPAAPVDAARIASRIADAAEGVLQSPVDVLRVSQLQGGRGWEATLSCPAAARAQLTDWVSSTQNLSVATDAHARFRSVREAGHGEAPVIPSSWFAAEAEGALGVLDFAAQQELVSSTVVLRVLMRPERFEVGPLLDFLFDAFPPQTPDGRWEVLRAEPAVTGLMTDVTLQCVCQRLPDVAAKALVAKATTVGPGEAGMWPYVIATAWTLPDKATPLRVQWRVFDCAQSGHLGSSVLYSDPPGRGCNRGRLTSGGCWAPAADDLSPWYRLDAGALRYIGGVVVLGRGDVQQDRVDWFSVEVSLDGINWMSQPSGEDNGGRWPGPDADKASFAYFAEPERCRYVRLLLSPRREGHDGSLCALRAGLLLSLRPGECSPLSDVRLSRAKVMAGQMRKAQMLQGTTLCLGTLAPKSPLQLATTPSSSDITLLAAAGEVVSVRFTARDNATALTRLREAIKLTPQLFVSVRLERSSIGSEEASALAKCLRGAHRLCLIDLDCNERFDDGCCRLLAASLRGLPALEELRLAHCKVTDRGLGFLCAALRDGCRGLRCLRLSGNRGLTSESRTVLQDLIDGTEIEHIELVGTMMSPVDQEDLAWRLKERRYANEPM